eukprot:TRINITY_DN9924_c0_g1_i1.p1 TRINITY_DN9924_c0_g1~~TRINITY_DN9924_c0_g1_i1.p1  ORF type:complete len:639 (-),score=118.37 TRINITY_DN9924_c0_g1_i1:19-1845(-)
MRVAIDAYCFLHKGKLACVKASLSVDAASAAWPVEREHDALLGPIMEIVAGLRSVSAEPVLVFDGGPLPAKEATEKLRREARGDARWKAALRMSAAGSDTVAQGPLDPVARLLQCAVDITPAMAAACIKKMRRQGVKCIVAPAEADAQLAHLALAGRVDVCVTEDVDLLAFGCPRVLFGLDNRGFCGREVRLEDLGKCRGLAPYRLTAETLPDLCVLGGCDYLPSLPGCGLRTAAQLLHRSGGSVRRALQLLRREGVVVPEDYGRQFAEARLVFASQVVYNDIEERLQPLRPLPASALEGNAEVALRRRQMLGLMRVDDATAREIAHGLVDPFTLKPFDNIELPPESQESQTNSSEKLAVTAEAPTADSKSPASGASPTCGAIAVRQHFTPPPAMEAKTSDSAVQQFRAPRPASRPASATDALENPTYRVTAVRKDFTPPRTIRQEVVAASATDAKENPICRVTAVRNDFAPPRTISQEVVTASATDAKENPMCKVTAVRKDFAPPRTISQEVVAASATDAKEKPICKVTAVCKHSAPLRAICQDVVEAKMCDGAIRQFRAPRSASKSASVTDAKEAKRELQRRNCLEPLPQQAMKRRRLGVRGPLIV